MIYTITMNPSLDYYVTVPALEMGKTNRSLKEVYLPGGKGINVSRVLQHLGTTSTAWGFYAGFVGEELIRCLEEIKLQQELIRLEEGITRINVKFTGFESTEVNAKGPTPDEKRLDELLKRCESLQEDDWIVLNGSIPGGVDPKIYEEIADTTKQNNATFVADVTGQNLKALLPYQPFLVKPNKQELEELFGETIGDRKDLIDHGRRLKDMGARNVLISMAGDGAVLIGEDERTYFGKVPKGNFVNGVGAGDSMLAGFLHGYLNQKELTEAFVYGMAAGSACAYSKDLPTGEAVMELLGECKDNLSLMEE